MTIGDFPDSIQIGAPATPGNGGDGEWEQRLQDSISALRDLEADAEDHQEALVIATCIANLRKLTAQRQSGAEAALGVTSAHKALSRAYQ